MFTKLPKWVEYGAFTLALIAGFVNAIGLLGFEHQAISHLSGSVTQIGVSLMERPIVSVFLIALVGSFVVGSTISGILISGESLKLGRHYDLVLLLEGILLLLSTFLLYEHISWGLCLASMACGLQNALVTTYSGAVIRTTHLTGIFTDLGLMLGSKIKGQEVNKRKFVMFSVIICGFLSGGVLGYLAFQRINVSALVIPAVCCLLLSFIYRIYTQVTSKYKFQQE
ncbi:YoaK family protein [Vibrio algivorus]|uniref:Membrane protein n=1 Tax=Vibrio algivorus TaxID=1667024 RepID=A0ABQ6EN86_9VIBR|nr:YoaK family protein [Vibrio algivorus]GLT14469.1 membrane protein [Vibrio algivorus]